MSYSLKPYRAKQITWPNKVTDISGLPRVKVFPGFRTFNFKSRPSSKQTRKVHLPYAAKAKVSGVWRFIHRRKLGDGFK